MSISVNSQPMIIGWKTQDATLSQSGNGKSVLKINSELPKLYMTITDPKLYIDQTQCFEESGLKGIRAFMADIGSKARQNVMRYISKSVSEGNTMADIQEYQNAIPMIAKQNVMNQNQHTFNMVTMPRSRPQIDLVMGKISYQFQEGQVSNTSRASELISSYQPWQYQFYVKQYSKIQIDFTNNQSVDFTI